MKRTALRGGTGGSHERTRALRAWPIKGRGVRLDRIPWPGAATRLCLDPRPSRGSPHHLSRSKLSSLPPLCGRRALQGGEMDAPIMERRKASRPVGRFDRITQLPARLTTGCLLDPCGLAYSLLRPPASTPKVVLARGWTTGLPPQAITTRRAETGPLDRLLRPRAG